MAQRGKSTDVTMNIVREKIGLDFKGFSPEMLELASATIESLTTVVEQAPRLKKLLSMLLNNQSSFLYKHSQMITFLCFHAIDNMECGSEEQKIKMAFISSFHNIALTRDELGSIESEEQLKDAEISKEDKDRVSKHAWPLLILLKIILKLLLVLIL